MTTPRVTKIIIETEEGDPIISKTYVINYDNLPSNCDKPTAIFLSETSVKNILGKFYDAEDPERCIADGSDIAALNGDKLGEAYSTATLIEHWSKMETNNLAPFVVKCAGCTCPRRDKFLITP